MARVQKQDYGHSCVRIHRCLNLQVYVLRVLFRSMGVVLGKQRWEPFAHARTPEERLADFKARNHDVCTVQEHPSSIDLKMCACNACSVFTVPP
jgi:hypothetical protein